MEDDDTPPRRPRRGPEALKVAREAAKAVAPIASRVETWQAESIVLTTRIRRSPAEAGAPPRERMAILLGLVEAELRGLEHLVVALPPAVAASGRLVDVARALEGIAERLKAALAGA